MSSWTAWEGVWMGGWDDVPVVEVLLAQHFVLGEGRGGGDACLGVVLLFVRGQGVPEL